MNARTGEYLDYVNRDEQHHVPLPNDYHANDDLPNKSHALLELLMVG